VRVDRFEEAVQIIKQCFTGEKFTHHGEHYRITDYTSHPLPVQSPGPPILIGGGGKRALSIAA
jgi:alkanesulfonate monooxygenase SsuD/methylene tetrahydromethanopterin reductase-like flavin-dependent oxidoreductase (luciferase family)